MKKPKTEPCEAAVSREDGNLCMIPTNLEYSYGGGDYVPLCLGHLMLEIQDLAQPYHDIQEQDIRIRRIA